MSMQETMFSLALGEKRAEKMQQRNDKELNPPNIDVFCAVFGSFEQQARELSTKDLRRHASVCKNNGCPCNGNGGDSFCCVAYKELKKRYAK